MVFIEHRKEKNQYGVVFIKRSLMGSCCGCCLRKRDHATQVSPIPLPNPKKFTHAGTSTVKIQVNSIGTQVKLIDNVPVSSSSTAPLVIVTNKVDVTSLDEIVRTTNFDSEVNSDINVREKLVSQRFFFPFLCLDRHS